MGLNSRQGGGGDLLSLDLAFALDKTLTSRKGPTPTFTRSSTGTFVGSNGLIQSAAINVPRFDHDPATGASKGLLIEETRTNLKTHSENFSDASWGYSGASPSTVSGSPPSGGATITKITEDTSTGGHGLAFSLSSTGTLTMSVFAKADGRQWLRLQGANIDTWFDIVNGVTGTVGVGHVATITNYGNGWWRCSVTFTTAASSSPLIRLAPSDGVSVYTGDGTSGLYLWGAQVEAGAFPTSYIPTTIGTAARSADVCSIIGDAFASFYNQSEGTLFARTQKTSSNTNAFITVANNGTFDNSIDVRYQSITSLQSIINFGASPQSSFTQAISSGTDTSQAIAYKANDAAYCAIGLTPVLDASVSVPTTNRLGIGQSLVTGTPLCLNGHIARIQYFRKRLSNAKLQTLTTP